MPDPGRYRRVKEIFSAAAPLESAEQARYLDEACQGDPALRAEVEAMLAAERDRPEFLEDSPGRRLAERARGEVPATIGPFQIRRLLGEGGMGRVFEAEQENPRRRVALKVLRLGLALPKLLHRFEHEKSVLALLQHPGIAQIYEAGTAETDGTTQPFFAMEYIDGVELMDFAQAKGLSVPARLELFIRICDAVQHAHQKGVIHRDLKPANILVTENGLPKVLDFGIARLTDSDIELTTRETGRAQILGTLSYMSPEQAAGRPEEIDARSDVYGLGVILYELLTDRRPHDLSATPLPEAVRVICEVPPRRISTHFKELRGDLETITDKALEKDKERRYATADALAADVRRFLAHEPITAKPAGGLYKAAKFARRNRLFMGALCALLISMVIGAVLTIQFAMREARLRRLNEQAAYRATIIAAGHELDAERGDLAAQLLASTASEFRDWEWRHLRRRVHQVVETYQEIGKPDNFVAYSGFLPATKQVFAIDRYSRCLLWDREGGKSRSVILGASPGELVEKRLPMAVRDDGKQLLTRTVTDSGQTAAVLWETTTGRIVQTFVADSLYPYYSSTQSPTFSAISADGRFVALRTRDRLLVYQVGSTEAVEILEGHQRPKGRAAATCCFSSHGPVLADTDARTVRVWDVSETGLERRITITCAAEVNEIALSARLLASSSGGSIDVWDLATGARVQQIPGEAPLQSLQFDPHGVLLIANSVRLQVWEARSGKLMRSLSGHPAHPKLHPTSGFLATGHGEYRRDDAIGVRILPLMPKASRILLGNQNPIVRVSLSRDGEHVASASVEGDVRLWDAQKGSGELHLAGVGDDFNRARGLSFAPPGDRILLASGGVGVWETTSGEARPARMRKAQKGYASAFSPDGSLVLIGRFKELDLLDGRTFEYQTSLDVRCGEITFSADGSRFATAAGIINEYKNPSEYLQEAKSITVFRTASRQREFLLSTAAPVLSLDFSRDGSRLASADVQGNLAIWDIEGRALEATLSADSAPVAAVVFLSPKRLASAHEDGAIRIWDVSTRGTITPLSMLTGHRGAVTALARSSDGDRLVSGSNDRTVRIWEAGPAIR